METRKRITLTEYIMEAVAKRKSGKYKKLERTYASMKEFLDSNGFVDSTGKGDYLDTEKAYIQDFSKMRPDRTIPYSMDVHCGEHFFDIRIDDTGDIYAILVRDRDNSKKNWYNITLERFEKIVTEF